MSEFVQVEAFVEALVEQPAEAVGRLPVGLLRVTQQLQGGSQVFDAAGEPVTGVAKAGLDAFTFDLDLAQPFADLGFGELGVGGEVEQAFFAYVEPGELLGEVGVQRVGGALLVGHGGFDQLADAGAEVLGQAQGGVVRDDGVLDLVGGQVG